MLTRREKNQIKKMIRSGVSYNGGVLLERAKQVEFERIEKFSQIIKEKKEHREIYLKTRVGQNDDSLNYIKSVRALYAGILASERRLEKLEEVAVL